jgi:hypothetical protein
MAMAKHTLAHKLNLFTVIFADTLLTTAQCATWRGVSIQYWKIGGSQCGPPHVVLAPRVIRYRRDAVNRWLQERSVASVADRRAKLGKG